MTGTALRARAVAPIVMLVLALASAVPSPSRAVMAGAPPDSPAGRIDANTDASRFAASAAVLVRGSAFGGALIARRHVITAAHVVGDAAPAQIRVRFNVANPVEIAAVQVHRHPGFIAFGTPNLHEDLAIVVLEREAPAAIVPYTVRRTPIAAGERFATAGYGASARGDGSGAVPPSASVKRRGQNRADALIADDDGGGLNEVFVFDFDGGGAPNAMGDNGLGNALETTYGASDSGSPVLRGNSGGELIGVATFVTAFAGGPTTPGTFGTGGGGMLVAAYLDWIDAVLAAPLPPADVAQADVPLSPGWLLGILGIGLAWAARRRPPPPPAAPRLDGRLE